MANSETGASTSDTLGGEYQVFLSFRGPDTRRTFTDILYQALVDVGIHVFIDDEGLRPGERISGNLLQAMDNSKLYIPIFSKDYASSHWCLDELVKMVDNTSKYKEDGKEKVILPIFYNVKPDDVKLKTELYNMALSNLEKKREGQEKKFSPEDIKTWRKALEDVGGIKGWEPDKYSGDGELIQAVVNEVVINLRTRQRQVTEDLVGMEDRIAAIKKLLDIDSGGVRLIGIYGMSGIGKTTLAKIIFNELCPCFGKYCSFLDDVREGAKTKGLMNLQQQLLSDISPSVGARNIRNIDDGVNRIGEILCKKKVLIVLDDVGGEGDQIQALIGKGSLYPGTRILVTTRDLSVLKNRKFKYEFLPYEMEVLSQKYALQLFSKHAFNDNSPLADYDTLSEGIVSTTSGLPLALEAIGSLLFYNKEKTIWEEKLDELRKTLDEDVLGKLRISYDALNKDQQQIFLDIACVCINEKKIDLIYAWKDCGYMAEYAINVLINRCMIKVLDDESFWMHDQFRDLGRAIAKQDRTRLWDSDDIICELRSTECHCQTGKSVQALRLSWGGPSQLCITVTSEQIKRFPHIQFLSLYEVNCQGDFTGCLPYLKWLSLRCYMSPDQTGRNQRLEATNLLHLENAVVVNLDGLQFTDDEFDSLVKWARKLKVLTVRRNHLMHRTPTFPENLFLEKLTIDENNLLSEIDCSLGKLRRLTDLSIEHCRIRKLPEQIGKLRRLTDLSIEHCRIRKLPEQIGELRNLRHLSLSSCDKLIELPDSVSKLELLTKLDVSYTRIPRLPHSIGRLSRLSFVNVSWTPIVEMPSTMSEFRQLQTLDLFGCKGIQELPKLPISLTTLRLKSASLLSIPNLSRLTNLVKLDLSDGSENNESRSDTIQPCDLSWIGSLSKLSKLYFWFPSVRAPTTELASLSLLKQLTLCGLDLPTFEQIPSNLIVLELYDARGKQVHLDGEKETDTRGKQVHLDGLPGCKELQAPELTDHRRGAFLFPSSQKKLQKFLLSGFPEVQDIQFVSTFESLEEFSVEECSSLRSLGGLSNLKNLKSLVIESCESLQDVEGINELEYLYFLAIDGCGPIKRFFDASSSKIPNYCRIQVPSKRGGNRRYYSWESCREEILNGRTLETESESESEIEATDSEIESEIEATDSEIGAIGAIGATNSEISKIEATDSKIEATDSKISEIGATDSEIGAIGAMDTEIGATDSEIGATDSETQPSMVACGEASRGVLQEMNQENKEKKRKRETQ